MSHRLLFDQNLSPKLKSQLAESFPGSLHAQDLGLERALDIDVLRAAEERGLVVVTRDKDFADLVTAHDSGPKLLWLQLGNVATNQIARALQTNVELITELLDDPSIRIVQVTASGSG